MIQPSFRTLPGTTMREIDHTEADQEVLIRTYRPEDQPAVRRLYQSGRLIGQVQPDDDTADIEDITGSYLESERGHFWVAEVEGRPVGIIGVWEDEADVAEIRRLRVDPGYTAHGVTTKLMETALAFCRREGYLKVILDTRIEQGPAMRLFERFAFQHNRTRSIGSKDLLEFYLDLYHEPRGDEREC